MHHVNVRIDELEEKLNVGFSHPRKKDGGQIGGIGSRSGSFTGGDSGGGGGGGGGVGGDDGGRGGDRPGSGAINFSQFNHFMSWQNRQMGLVQQEVIEIKQLMFQLRKVPPSSHSGLSHLLHLLDSDSSKQPHLLGAIPGVSGTESREMYATGISDQQQQQKQPFISQGPNVFQARQPQDGLIRYTDSKSRLPDSFPQSETMRSQRRELDDHQDPISSYPLPRVEYTTEVDHSARSKSV